MQRPINVLELRSVRGTGGGPEKTILVGAAKADRTRFNVIVCYVRDDRDQVFELDARARSLGVDYAEVTERNSFDVQVLSKLVALVRERGIDIVHAHEYKSDLLAWLLARRTNVIPFATAHGWTGDSGRERLLYYPADKWLLARFPRVVAVSSDIRNQLVARGARPERVTVILNGIDPDAFRRVPARRAEVRAQLGLADDELVVGSVGRVEQQKRFDLLLDAMVPILARRPRTRVVIVGDGSLLPRLREQARNLRIEERVLFTGHRGDIADLHHAFDLFVQSSEYEGTPNAVLEAMAMETPLVATDAGGTGELAADGVHGLIVPCRDTAALEQAIEAALTDPDAARSRATAARRRIESDLSFDARTRRLEALYAELAATLPSRQVSGHDRTG